MSMTTEKRAKELANIEPPRSVVRISGFLRDLTRSGMPRFDPLPGGGGPMLALAARGPFLPGGGFLEAFARLTAHYAVQAVDLEAFATWLALWVEKYGEMEVIEDPTVHAEPAFPLRPRPVVGPVVAIPSPSAPEEEPLRPPRRERPPRPAPDRAGSPGADPLATNRAATDSAPSGSPRRTFEPARRPADRLPGEPEGASGSPDRIDLDRIDLDRIDPGRIDRRRIDLQGLVRRTQVGAFGGGMMVLGAALAPRPGAASRAFPAIDVPGFDVPGFDAPGFDAPGDVPHPVSPPGPVVRTTGRERAGDPLSSRFSPSSRLSQGPGARDLLASLPSVGDPAPRDGTSPLREAAFLQPEEVRPRPPTRPDRPLVGMPSLPDGPSVFLEGPAKPEIPPSSGPDPSAFLPEAARVPVRWPGGRTFPTVATILGMVGLGIATEAATSHRPRHGVDRPLPRPGGDDSPGGDGLAGDIVEVEERTRNTGTTPRPRPGEGRPAEASPGVRPGRRPARSVPAAEGDAPDRADPDGAHPDGADPVGARRVRGSAPTFVSRLFVARDGVAYRGDFSNGIASEEGYWTQEPGAEEARWVPQRIVSSNRPVSPRARGLGTIPDEPRFGQITLVAPPLTVASAEGERAGSAVEFDWAQLATSSGEVDADGVAGLARVLPAGAQAIYPALPRGAGGTNLRLNPALLAQILERGYGPQAAGRARAIAAATPAPARSGATTASLVPLGRPVGTDAEGGVLGRGDGVADAGGAQAKRGGALDFLGLPVRLAPTLGGRPELRQQQLVQKAGSDLAAGRPVRPEAFAPLQKRLFPGLGSVTVEPDEAQWRRAAPSFGLRGADPTTVLSNDATLRPLSAATPRPSISAPGLPGSLASRLLPNVAAHGPAAPPYPGRLRTEPSSSARTSFERAPWVGLGHPGGHPRTAGLETGFAAGDGTPRFSPSHAGMRAPGLDASGGHLVPRHPGGGSFGRSSIAAPGVPSVAAVSAPQSAASPSVGSPSGFRPLSRIDPPGAGRTTSTAAPATESGGHVPFVRRPAEPAAPPSLPPAARPAAFGGLRGPARPESRAGTLAGSPPPVGPRSPSLPALPSVATISRTRPSWGAAAPEMLYAPAAAPRTAAGGGALAIQRSTGGAAPAAHTVGAAAPKPSPAFTGKGKSEAAEIDSLATEVWSLLRRRLAHEAERRGRY